MAVTCRYWVRAASVSAAIVALAGCGHSGNSASRSAPTTPHATWSRPSAPPDPRTLERAGATAVAAVPNATLTSIRTEQGATWRVLVVSQDGTEQAMDVASDGGILMVGPTATNTPDADKATNRARVQAAHLDYRAAVGKLLAAVPNCSITELNLGDSNGSTVWEANVWDKFIVEHKVTVNAASGELIANKQV